MPGEGLGGIPEWRRLAGAIGEDPGDVVRAAVGVATGTGNPAATAQLGVGGIVKENFAQQDSGRQRLSRDIYFPDGLSRGQIQHRDGAA